MFAARVFSLAAVLVIGPCVAETLPTITITDATGGGYALWRTALFAPGTEISLSNGLNRSLEVPGLPASFPDVLREIIGAARYPEGPLTVNGSTYFVALCCGQPLMYFYTPPLVPFTTDPSLTFDAVLRGSSTACIVLGSDTNPCTDHPVFVADVIVDIPGRVTLNLVGPDQGVDRLVSGTFTQSPEPVTLAAVASALAVLLQRRRDR